MRLLFLAIGFGKSFNYGDAWMSLNLVFATNPDGNRYSFIFGYIIEKVRSGSTP